MTNLNYYRIGVHIEGHYKGETYFDTRGDPLGCRKMFYEGRVYYVVKCRPDETGKHHYTMNLQPTKNEN